jgi:transposase
VPRQPTTGSKPKLLGKSLVGNRYLRMLLVHAARAASFIIIEQKPTRALAGLQNLVKRRGFHKANVALANKNARVVWKLEPYIF